MEWAASRAIRLRVCSSSATITASSRVSTKMIAYSARWGDDGDGDGDEDETAPGAADEPTPAAEFVPAGALAAAAWSATAGGARVSAEGSAAAPGHTCSAPLSRLDAAVTAKSLGEAEADWPPECFRCCCCCWAAMPAIEVVAAALDIIRRCRLEPSSCDVGVGVAAPLPP